MTPDDANDGRLQSEAILHSKWDAQAILLKMGGDFTQNGTAEEAILLKMGSCVTRHSNGRRTYKRWERSNVDLSVPLTRTQCSLICPPGKKKPGCAARMPVVIECAN